MSRPLVHRDGREVTVQLPDSEPLEAEFIENPDVGGDLTFSDGNAGTHTLSDLVAGGPVIDPGEARVSGIKSQGHGQLSVASVTQVQIAAATDAIFLERQAGSAAIEHPANWSVDTVTVSPAGLAQRQVYWIAEDPGFTGTASIQERLTAPTEAELRTPWIFLGISLHEAGEVKAVISAPNVFNDQGHLLNDLIRIDGVLRKSGNVSEIATTLTASHSAIVFFGRGIKFHSSFLDPNNNTVPASAGAFGFATIAGDGKVFDSSTTIFPQTWNNGGVETALTGIRTAIHQIVMLFDGSIVVQLGTTNHQNYQDAVEAIGLEVVNNPLWDVALNYGETLGFALVSNQSVQWDGTRARIFQVVPGQSIPTGSSVSKFTQLSDTPSFFTGAKGQLVTVKETESGLEFRKNRAQIILSPTVVNVDATGGAVLDVAMPARINSFKFHIENVNVRVKTAPTGVDLVVDVRIGGTSIFSGSFPTILAGADEGDQAPNTTDHLQSSKIEVDISSGNATWQHLSVALQGWVEPE